MCTVSAFRYECPKCTGFPGGVWAASASSFAEHRKVTNERRSIAAKPTAAKPPAVSVFGRLAAHGLDGLASSTPMVPFSFSRGARILPRHAPTAVVVFFLFPQPSSV